MKQDFVSEQGSPRSPRSKDTANPLWIGVCAARSLALPALAIVLAAGALVTAYYLSSSVAGTLQRIADLKSSMGPAFAMASTALLAGVVPLAFRIAIPSLRPAHPGRELAFGIVWWGSMGLVLDHFYGLLATIYDSRGWSIPATVIAKVASDMLLFTPLFASPANAISHLWKDLDFSFEALRARMKGNWYARIVLPNLVPNLVVWIPGVACVYAMPQDLQLPLANLIGCFWALMCLQIASITRHTR